MTVRQIIGTGLTRALGTGLIADLAWGNTAAGALKCLKDHFTLDGRDLAAAFQDSLGRGAGAIALGLSVEGAGVLARLGQGARRALSPNLARAYAAAVERDFLRPYGAARGLSADALAGLRRRTLDACRALAQRCAEILPVADLDETALATLAQGAFRDDLTDLLLARCTELLPDLDPEVRGLLAHQGLLGDALLWFLRERLRADPRVCATLDALQREGLWADLRDLKAAQAALTGVLAANLDRGQVQVTEAMQSGDFARATALTTQLQALAAHRSGLPALLERAHGRRQAAEGALLRLPEAPAALDALVELRLDDLTGALSEVAGRLDAAVAAAQGARDAAQAAGSKVDAWGGLLQDDLEALGVGLGTRLDLLPQAVAAVILRVLRPGNLGFRITPGDEFTRHDGAARGLIRQAQAELASLPPGPGHSVAALAVGSALSSTGAAAAAEALFQHALECAQTDAERALAAYNLFQVRLRQGAPRYPDAFGGAPPGGGPGPRPLCDP